MILGHVRRNLIECLGAGRPLREISPTDADAVRLAMIREGLADSTIAKRLQRARQMFAAAKRRGLVDGNPFGDVKHNEGNPAERQRFIERETVARILAVCNPTWRLITVLCRYGGLRCPSEVLSLKLAGIDWAAARLRVDSPKTEHHPGRGSRIIPLFPELRAELEAAWDRAAPGEVYAVCGPDADAYRVAAQGPDGWRNANLRTQFNRILKRAGVAAWPKPFQNMRLSRETELAAEYPLHVVTAWLGNTPKVAMRHYLTVTDADFDRAGGGAAKSAADALQKALQMRCKMRCSRHKPLSAPMRIGRRKPKSEKHLGIHRPMVTYSGWNHQWRGQDANTPRKTRGKRGLTIRARQNARHFRPKRLRHTLTCDG